MDVDSIWDAGRVTRMVRLIRFVRALKIFIMIRRYFARKIDDGGKERSIAPSSIGNSLNDRISLLVGQWDVVLGDDVTGGILGDDDDDGGVITQSR